MVRPVRFALAASATCATLPATARAQDDAAEGLDPLTRAYAYGALVAIGLLGLFLLVLIRLGAHRVRRWVKLNRGPSHFASALAPPRRIGQPHMSMRREAAPPSGSGDRSSTIRNTEAGEGWPERGGS